MTAATTILTQVSAVGTGIMYALYGALILSPLLVIMFIYLWRAKFKHQIVVRRVTKGNSDIILNTKFRVVNKKGEPIKIKTLKGKYTFAHPPKEAIEMTDKGKMYVECYVSDSGEATWINVQNKVNTTKRQIAVQLPSVNKKGQPVVDEDGNQIYTTETREIIEDVKLQRMSTEDKAFYFEEHKKAEDLYKKQNVWSFLNNHAGALILLLVVVTILIFMADAMAPFVEWRQAAVSERNAQRQHEIEMIKLQDQLAAKLLKISEYVNIPEPQVFNVTQPAAVPD